MVVGFYPGPSFRNCATRTSGNHRFRQITIAPIYNL
jgi:hypothetical protein